METSKLQTPCFVIDKADMEDSIRSFRRAMRLRFDKVVIGYSVKTNPLPFVLTLARDNGCYAEVVSYNEYNLALKVGFAPSHIIYNGCLKSRETFLRAIKSGAIVNVETWREIDWLREAAHTIMGGVRVGLRININISKVSPADAANSDDDSRLGFSMESGELQKAVNAINAIGNVRIVGIHTHREPKTRSVRFYKNVIGYVQDIVRPMSEFLEYWDLGGGFFGSVPGKLTFQDYADGFYDAMKPWARQLKIIVEPGNAIVASAFTYVTTVIDCKQHDDTVYVTTDGTRNDIDPFFRKSDYFKRFSCQQEEGKPSACPQVVCGLSCLEYDRIFTIPVGERLLRPGDRIVYDRVGAYTMALTPLFIHYFPTVYMIDNGKISVVRDEWGEEEFIQKSTL